MSDDELTSSELANRMMNKSDVHLEYFGDASPDFITNMVHNHETHPTVKYWKDGEIKCASQSEMSPRLTVVFAKQVDRYYGTDVQSVSVMVHTLVLMDGSNCLIKAVTSTDLSPFMENLDIMAGMTCILKDYAMVAMVSSNNRQWKHCLLMKDLAWRMAPDQRTNGPASVDPAAHIIGDDEGYSNKTRIRIDAGWIATCLQTGYVGFGHSYQDPQDIYTDAIRWTSVHAAKFPCGAWIKDDATRGSWQRQFTQSCILDNQNFDPPSHTLSGCPTSSPDKKKARYQAGSDSASDHDSAASSGSYCQCVLDFGFLVCVKESFPIGTLDLEQILRSCQPCLCGGENKAQAFAQLPNKQKGWCLRWWYAVNIIQIRTFSPKLPACLVDYIQDTFPMNNLDSESGNSSFV